MKMNGLRTFLWRYFMAATCLLLMLLLTTQEIAACSWDYLIWMNRTKSADPLYRFVQNGKAGYIDRSGRVVIKPQIEAYGNYGGEFHDGLLNIYISDGKYLDKTGKLVLSLNQGSDFSEGLAVARPENSEKWGFVNHKGEFVISPRFETTYPNSYVSSFSDGLALIKVAKKYGYIDRSGEFALKPKFLHGTDFLDGMARVVIEGPCRYFEAGMCPDFDGTVLGEDDGKQVPRCKFSFINKSGSIISSARYDGAKDFSEGLAPVLIGEKWGYIDKRGQVVVEPQFDGAESFSDGLARVQQGRFYGYIDYTGTIVILPQFNYAEDFSDGLAVVGNWNEEQYSSDEFYYINKEGIQAIPGKFALASHFFKGLAHVKLKSKKEEFNNNDSGIGTFAYIDITGKKVFTYRGEK